MADMLDIDRVSMGWNVWLTRRQTRVILEALRGHWAEKKDQECLQGLVEWFDGMVA